MSTLVDYTPRFLGTTCVERDRDNPLRLGVYVNGSIQAPASGTVSLYNASNVAVVDAASIVITDSFATYTVTSAMLTGQSVGPNWRIEWSLVMPDGNTHLFRNSAAHVIKRLDPACTDADLLARHPDLSDYLPRGQTNWQTQIDTAHVLIQGKLENKGRRPWLIVSQGALKTLYEYETLAIVCGLMGGQGDPDNKWSRLTERYEAKASAEWDSLTLEYDEAHDGTATSGKRTGMSSVWLCSTGSRW